MAKKRLKSLHEVVMSQEMMGHHFSHEPASWVPLVDLFETDESVYLFAELPGMTEEEINIEIKDGFLYIQGERKPNRKSEDTYICAERSYGVFLRRFPMPARVDEENICAEFSLGVLKITIPKLKGGKKRIVPVEAE